MREIIFLNHPEHDRYSINRYSHLGILVLFCSLLFEEYISYNSQEEIDPNKVSLLNEQFLPLIRLLENK